MLIPVGYAGGSKTSAELGRWKQWSMLDPEFARRLLALFEASDGRVGIGGGGREETQQRALFLSRYHDCADGLFWEGRRWCKNAGVAPAAPPGRSYHERTTPAGGVLAADLIGDLPWAQANAGRFGLKHFLAINGEGWHFQPVEIPNSRRTYDPRVHGLKVWALPGGGASKPPAAGVVTPKPTLRVGSTGDQVRLLQEHLVRLKQLASRVDGQFGPKTEAAVMGLQAMLKVQMDGVYGPKTAAAYATFQAFIAALGG